MNTPLRPRTRYRTLAIVLTMLVPMTAIPTGCADDPAPTDLQIQQSVQSLLDEKIEAPDYAEATVAGGVVTLTGKIANESARDEMASTVEAVDGVTDVVDETTPTDGLAE